MSITLSRRWLLAALGLAVGLAAAAFSGARLLRPAAPAGPAPDQAAAAFLRAFYTVDYRDRTGWLAALQPLATEAGRQLVANLLAPAAWPALTQGQTVTTADQVAVTDDGLRAEDAGEGQPGDGGRWQIRRLTVTIAEAGRWPGMRPEPFGANVLLVEEAEGWKFAAFLSDADVLAFRQKGGRP